MNIEQLFYVVGALFCLLAAVLLCAFATFLVVMLAHRTLNYSRAAAYGAIFYWHGKANAKCCKRAIGGYLRAAATNNNPYEDYQLKESIMKAAKKIKDRIQEHEER
jgi:hypothetical protein